MSQQLKLSNKEYLETRDDTRLLIEESDVPRLISLAKTKGFKDEDIATLYVVAVDGIPEETADGQYEAYEQSDLIALAADVDRMIYDEKNKRVVGFLPPLPPMVEK